MEGQALIFKTCNKCKEKKLTSDFHKNKKKPDGLQVMCKECTKELGKIAREKKRRFSAGEYIVAKATEIPKLTRTILENMEFTIGGQYQVIQKGPRQAVEKFEGTLVNQTDRYITLKHSKFGYLESFLKADFATGERKLKEVV